MKCLQIGEESHLFSKKSGLCKDGFCKPWDWATDVFGKNTISKNIGKIFLQKLKKWDVNTMSKNQGGGFWATDFRLFRPFEGQNWSTNGPTTLVMFSYYHFFRINLGR